MPYAPAPFFRRLAARILDLAFCLLLTFVIAIPMSILFIPIRMAVDEAHKDAVVAVAVALCYFISYVGLEVFLLARRDGQTLGKGLLGLRVVPAGQARFQLTAVPATMRILVIFLPFVFMSLAGSNPDSGILNAISTVGILTILVSLVIAAVPAGSRRTLHDLAAGSRVVRATVRKIDLRHDLPMVVPGKVNMAKRLPQ